MLIQSLNKYNETLIMSKGYINEISFADDKIIQLLNKVSNIDKLELISILNSINNQGLQDIDIENLRYKNRDKWLGFSKLSKAEKVFLIAYIAKVTNTVVYLHTDITQLTKTTLRLFIKIFNNSEYVNIVYDSSISDAFYNAMRREALL